MQSGSASQKKCSKCKGMKSLDAFYRHPKDGHQAQCKICQRDGKRRGDKTRQQLIAEVRPDSDHKRCAHCNEVLPVEQFASRGGERAGETKAWCRSCCSESFKIWHRRNGGKSHEERRAEHYQFIRPDLLTKFCTGCKEHKPVSEFQRTTQSRDGLKWRCSACHSQQNRTIYNRNVKREREKRRLYRENNQERVRQYAVDGERRRRARKMNVESTLTRTQWERILRRYGYRCLACGSSENLTIDHVVPISKGGEDTERNVQPLCGSCNSSKGVRVMNFRDDQDAA